MRFSLLQRVRAIGNRRRRIVIRRTRPTPALLAELRAILNAVVDPWQEAAAEIANAYRLATLSDGLVTDAGAADLNTLIMTIRNRQRAVIVRLRALVMAWSAKAEVSHRRQWREGVLAATGVDLDTVLSPFDMQETLETVLERNAALITSIDDDVAARISDAVFRALQKRGSVADVRRDIMAATEIGRKRADLIARDQLNKAFAALDRARRQEAGIASWRWRHSGKLHFRPEHKARDGKIYSDDDPPADLPGELPYCGCTSEAVLLDSAGNEIGAPRQKEEVQ